MELLLDLVAGAPQLLAAYFIIDEDNMRAALSRPWVTICSDSEAPASAVTPAMSGCCRCRRRCGG